MQRLHVVLDGTPHSHGALRLGCEWAQESAGTLVGLPLVEESYGAPHSTEANEPAAARRDVVEARLHAIEREFMGSCRVFGVAHQFARPRRSVLPMLLGEIVRSDMVLMGQRTHSRDVVIPDSNELLQTLVGAHLGPLVIVPTQAQTPDEIIMAHDGSAAATRAMRLLNYQVKERGVRAKITVLSVSSNLDQGRFFVEAASQYLRSHGHLVASVVRQGPPVEVILAEAGQRPNAMVALGTTSKELSSDDSVTGMLLKRSTSPLYLAA